jgi:hypothetical protein
MFSSAFFVPDFPGGSTIKEIDMSKVMISGTGIFPINGLSVALWVDSSHPWEGKVVPAQFKVAEKEEDVGMMGREISWEEYAALLEADNAEIASLREADGEMTYSECGETPAQLPPEMDPSWGPFVPGGLEVTYWEYAFWAREESYPPVAWEEVSLTSFARHMAEKEADDRHNWIEDAARGYV